MRVFILLETSEKAKKTNNLTIYHQNIRSLNKIKDELNVMLEEYQGRPHLIRLSENHMEKKEMKNFSFLEYKLAYSFCRETYSKGGVCILARNDIIYQAINPNKLCKEKVFEISAVTIHTCSTKVILCCVYRSSSENPNYFLQHLQKTLKII